MIELNLLPEDMRAARKKKAMPKVNIKLPKIPIVPLIITAGSIFIAIHLGLFIFHAIQKNRLTSLQAEKQRLMPQEADAQKLRAEVAKLSKKYAVIDSLASGGFLWSSKLSDLSQAVTDGVWLTSLYLQIEAPDQKAIALSTAGAPVPREVMVLEGTAVSTMPGEETAIVGKFIESLKKHQGFFDDFEEIKLSSIERKKLGEVEVMKFTLFCYCKSGRSNFEKLKY